MIMEISEKLRKLANEINDKMQQDHQTLIKTIKDWFQYNYTLNYEEYSCSKVELVGENTFRLIIPCSGEIKEMEIPTTVAELQGYKFGKVKISSKVISGSKVGYAGGSDKGSIVKGYIVIDSRFIDYCEDNSLDDLVNTVKHEVSHLIAETFNTKKKGVWHGQAWKDVFISLGGNGDRYYKGKFVKPENEGKSFKTKEELYNTLPTQPANTWERGTYRQWLERGYHVIKGQKGQFVQWQFSAEEYETDQDGKTSKWGRASAVYFTPDQVEANQPKEVK